VYFFIHSFLLILTIYINVVECWQKIALLVFSGFTNVLTCRRTGWQKPKELFVRWLFFHYAAQRFVSF